MIPSPVVWGLLLGLGSSLHCAGMCGPIGCAFLLSTKPGANRSSIAARLAAMQFGRILSYCGLGMLFGTFGASLYSVANFTGIHQMLQWAAGGTIIWLGLSTSGLVPSFAGVDRALAPAAGALARLRSSLGAVGPEASLVSGMLWGLTPCAMVYAAIFNSLLTGDLLSGGVLMLSFGIGTIPAVVASTLALYQARRAARRPGRQMAGALMIAGGVLALALTVPGSPFCITGA